MKVMRRTIFLFFVLLMSLEAYAQTLISGTVTDAKGLSVIGAAVHLKGDQAIGTVTDLDGKWQLAIPEDRLEGAVLIISSMGYITV